MSKTLRPIAAPRPTAFPRLVAAAVLAALSAPAFADVPLFEAGGTAVSTEGLLQYDWNGFDDDVADLDGDPFDDDSSEYAMRRAEVVLKGAGPGKFSWALGYDFAAEKFLDAYGAWKFDSGTTLTVGQSKVPVGLEALGSSRTHDFVAVSAASMFSFGRRLGIKAQHVAGDWTLTGSAFGREYGELTARGGGFAARAAWAPVQAEGRLLHLAASLADADTNGDTVRLRARPQADLAVVRLADAGTMRDADRLRTVGVEGAWVHGPFKVQAEWLHGDVDRYGGSPDFGADAGYVSAVWNVTGETWTYKAGTIATAAPASPAAGLWQLGLRHDRVDLDDGTVAGGTMSAWTAGVNWYWRRHVRLSLNHVRVESERAGVDDDPSIVEARVQLHW
jgi:phosphate-selective porin OprO and OprP